MYSRFSDLEPYSPIVKIILTFQLLTYKVLIVNLLISRLLRDPMETQVHLVTEVTLV